MSDNDKKNNEGIQPHDDAAAKAQADAYGKARGQKESFGKKADKPDADSPNDSSTDQGDANYEVPAIAAEVVSEDELAELRGQQKRSTPEGDEEPETLQSQKPPADIEEPEEQEAEPEEEPEKPQSRRFPKRAVAAVAGLLAVVFAGNAFFGNRDKAEQEPEEITEAKIATMDGARASTEADVTTGEPREKFSTLDGGQRVAGLTEAFEGDGAAAQLSYSCQAFATVDKHGSLVYVLPSEPMQGWDQASIKYAFDQARDQMKESNQAVAFSRLSRRASATTDCMDRHSIAIPEKFLTDDQNTELVYELALNAVWSNNKPSHSTKTKLDLVTDMTKGNELSWVQQDVDATLPRLESERNVIASMQLVAGTKMPVKQVVVQDEAVADDNIVKVVKNSSNSQTPMIEVTNMAHSNCKNLKVTIETVGNVEAKKVIILPDCSAALTLD